MPLRRSSVWTASLVFLAACGGGTPSSLDGGGDARSGGRGGGDAAADTLASHDAEATDRPSESGAADAPPGSDRPPEGGPSVDVAPHEDGGVDKASDVPDAGPISGPDTGAPPTVDAGSDVATVQDGAASAGDAGTAVDAGGGVDSAPAAPQWVWMGAPVGAPIGAVALDDRGTLLAGANSDIVGFGIPLAGVFASDDEGASWRPVNRGLRDFRIQSLAASPHAWFAGSGILVRSLDRGATWEQVPGVAEDVRAIAAQGSLVATNAPTYAISTDEGATFTASPFQLFADEVAVMGDVVLRAG